VPYDSTGWSMEKRVGQHCSIVLEIMKQFSKKYKERAVKVKGVPRYAEVLDKGVGYFYKDPSTVESGQIYFN